MLLLLIFLLSVADEPCHRPDSLCDVVIHPKNGFENVWPQRCKKENKQDDHGQREDNLPPFQLPGKIHRWGDTANGVDRIGYHGDDGVNTFLVEGKLDDIEVEEDGLLCSVCSTVIEFNPIISGCFFI